MKTTQHSYIACVRETTKNLPGIDDVASFSEADDACLQELQSVLAKHGAASRFGVSLLHSHFPMGEDEVLLEETDVDGRKQTLSVVKRKDVPTGAIYMDRRFDLAERDPAVILYAKMADYRSELLSHKLQKDLSLSAADAQILFEDVKRFIALCASTSEPIAPPRFVDHAWHQFILLTKDYAKFCSLYCGRFIHHQPADPYERSKDYGAERRRTVALAERAFGKLSSNWDEAAAGGDCTHNCGTGECESDVAGS